MNPIDDIPQEPVAGQMSVTAPAQRTPLSEPVRQMPREPDNPLAADESQSLLSALPKSAPPKPWRPPGAADSGGGSPGVMRSASAGALRERQASSRDRGGHRDRRMQRSASCANSEGQQLRRAPAFRNLPVPEIQISMPPDARERRTRDSREDKEQELQVSPQSRATATTATSAAPSSYWGLGTPSSRNGRRQEMRPPEPSSPCQDFLYLSVHQLRQHWQAREEELASTKARAEALRVMLKQQLEERKKSRPQKAELAELAAKDAKQQEALAMSEAALRKERQHRRALYDEVRRLTPKTWRRPCSKPATNRDAQPQVTTKRASSSGDAKSQVRRSKTPSFEEIPAGVPLPRSSESPSSRKGSPKRAGAKVAKKSRGSQSQEPSETAVSTPCDNSNEKEVCFKEPGDDKENCSSQLEETSDKSGVEKVKPKRENRGRSSSLASIQRSSRIKAVDAEVDAEKAGSTLCGAGPLPPTETKDAWVMQTEDDASPALDSLKSGSEQPPLEKQQEEESLQMGSQQSTLMTLPKEVVQLPQQDPMLVRRDAGTPLREEVVFKPSRVVEQIPTEPVVEPVVPMGSMGPWVSSKSLAAPPKETHRNEPTLLSRCHVLAASRQLCEAAQQRAMKQQAALMEAQWREDAVMNELLQQDLGRQRPRIAERIAEPIGGRGLL